MDDDLRARIDELNEVTARLSEMGRTANAEREAREARHMSPAQEIRLLFLRAYIAPRFADTGRYELPIGLARPLGVPEPGEPGPMGHDLADQLDDLNRQARETLG